MANEDLILDKLTEIANKLDEQNLLQKTVLNFNEAAKYLDVSPHICTNLPVQSTFLISVRRAKNFTSNGTSWIVGCNATDNQRPTKLSSWQLIMLSATNAASNFF